MSANNNRRLPFTNKSLLFAVKQFQNNKSEAIKLYGPIEEWNTSEVTDMSYLFEANIVFNEDISEWDTSSVTNMQYMFKNASAFNQPLNKWNTSSVKDMSHMFEYAIKFNQPLDA